MLRPQSSLELMYIFQLKTASHEDNVYTVVVQTHFPLMLYAQAINSEECMHRTDQVSACLSIGSALMAAKKVHIVGDMLL